MSRATDRFVEAARVLGIRVEARRFPEGTRTAGDAARAIGCSLGQIVKSLVFVADGRPVVVLTSGMNRVDLERLRGVLGAAALRRATPDEARAATSYAVGGTPPFGYPERVRAVMDRDLLEFEEVWAAAGAPDSVFPLSPSELRRASGATPRDFKETARGDET